MKTAIIRSAVITLVFAGFSASTVASMKPSAPGVKFAVKGGPSTVPTPACGPHDPTRCGADQF